jgi:hypothetical protein
MTITGLRLTENLLKSWDEIPMPFSLSQFSDDTPGGSIIDPGFWINSTTRQATNTVLHFTARSIGACASIPYDLFQGTVNKSDPHYNDALLTVPKIATNLVKDCALIALGTVMSVVSTGFIIGGISIYAGSAVVSYAVEAVANVGAHAIDRAEHIHNA